MWVALSALHMFLIISSLKDFWQLKLLLGEAPTNTAVFHGHAEPSLFIYTFTGYFFSPHYTHTQRCTKYNTGNLGDFPGGPDVKNLPAIRKTRFDAWVGMMPWRRNGYPLQCSCLESSMDRGAW